MSGRSSPAPEGAKGRPVGVGLPVLEPRDLDRSVLPRLPLPVQSAFDAGMAALGPFEDAPFLAVAVSGGPDSLGLVLLAASWVGERGGRLLGLTVDHGLRPEAASEAAGIGAWLRGLGIPHETLLWSGPKPAANIQAEARAVRYGMLAQRCRLSGCLHLLTGHHADDVAETFLLRLGRGSGLSGLAAMAPEVALGPVRLLRPLLAVRRQVLADALPAGVPVVDDPSNASRRYARARIRQAAPELAAIGLSLDRLARTAADLRRAREAMGEGAAALSLRSVRLHRAGFASLAPPPFVEAPPEIGLRLLAELLAAVGGQDYPPRFERLERLHRDVAANGIGRGRTLSGCRILPCRGRILVCREPAACAPPLAMPEAGEPALFWDGRFQIRSARPVAPGVCWGALGHRRISGVAGAPLLLPGAVLPGLPTLTDAAGIVAVPHLGWEREPGALGGFDVRWRPRRIAAGINASAGYTVV